jgi:ribosomal protein L11 methyltransferase
LIIAPSWEIPEPEPGKKIIIIDPGQAFGTGHHESTLLCMKRISRLAKRDLLPQRVLDVGCGTGILSFTALAFGAQSAVGVDLDPEAIKAARQNAKINNMADRVEFSETPLGSITEKFPLVLANITAKDITGLASELADHLAPGGELVVSGILPEQTTQIRDILEQAGLTFMELNTMAAWSSLVMT